VIEVQLKEFSRLAKLVDVANRRENQYDCEHRIQVNSNNPMSATEAWCMHAGTSILSAIMESLYACN
jgi:hypothetical protein